MVPALTMAPELFLICAVCCAQVVTVCGVMPLESAGD
jgi:hypothetical protein